MLIVIACFRIGAFSVFNTSIYSEEEPFTTKTKTTTTTSIYSEKPTKDFSTDDGFQNSIVIIVAVTISLVVLVIIAITLACLMRRKKKAKRKNNPQYVPGLEDLIEMRTRTHSGGADSRGNRDLLELGKLRHLSFGIS